MKKYCASEMKPKVKKELSRRDEMIAAWRTLYYGDLLSEKGKDSISKKLNRKYP